MLLGKTAPNFDTVTAGKDNSLELTEGYQYSVVRLKVGDDNGTTLASGNLVNDIVFKLNDTEQWRLTGQQLAAEYAKRGAKYGVQSNGQPGQAGYTEIIPIWFDAPWFRPRAAGRAFALNALAGTNPQIVVNLGAGLVNPVLTPTMEYVPLPQGAKLGAITKYLRQILPVSGNSNEFSKFASIAGKGDLIQGMTLWPNGNVFVNKVSFSRNGINILDQRDYVDNQASLIGRGWTPDLSAVPQYNILFDNEDEQDPGLVTLGANELTLTTWYSGANNGNMTNIIELLGNPN